MGAVKLNDVLKAFHDINTATEKLHSIQDKIEQFANQGKTVPNSLFREMAVVKKEYDTATKKYHSLAQRFAAQEKES